ncbi:Rab-like protein 3 [Dirofilaria immitis]|nr:Rab-like protein 3 [Dirofilaria immitis]
MTYELFVSALLEYVGCSKIIMRNCYDVLGCSSIASYSELKEAYFSKLRKNHPDKGGSSTALFLVTKAWAVLKDENTRRDYNIWLREQLLRENQGIISRQIVIDNRIEQVEEFCSCGGKFILEKADIDRIVNSAYFECPNCSLCLEVVVLGSSGVGKSSFVNAVCNRHDMIPSSTVGCAVSVIAHQYRAGSTEEQTELIELWDIGGATGAILVHDLSNKKSESNLSQWIALLRGESSLSSIISPFTSSSSGSRFLLSDIESTPIPTLVVGCKSDLAPERAKQTAYDRICLNCRRPISPGSTNRIVLSKFLIQLLNVKSAYGWRKAA